MAFSLVMQAPTGAGIGGQYTATPSGTIYTTNSNGQLTVTSQSDVDFFIRQGFYAVQTFVNRIAVNAPLAGELVSVVTSVTPSNVALTLVAGQPVQPRKLQYRIIIGTPTTTAITAGTLTVVGTDQDGNAITEVVSLIENATATKTSAYAWASITSATIAGYVASGSGAGNTISIGVTNDFGMPTGQSPANFAIVKANKIVVTFTSSTTASSVNWTVLTTDDTASSATVDTVARTINPTTTPSASGLDSYEFSYQYQLRA